MSKKTRYTMVGRDGNEIYHADSFLGFIAIQILTACGSALAIAIVGGIICGIASLF